MLPAPSRFHRLSHARYFRTENGHERRCNEHAERYRAGRMHGGKASGHGGGLYAHAERRGEKHRAETIGHSDRSVGAAPVSEIGDEREQAADDDIRRQDLQTAFITAEQH